MYCPTCGLSNENDATFCYSCGARITGSPFDVPEEVLVLEEASEPYRPCGETTGDDPRYEEFRRKVAGEVFSSMEKAEYAAEVARLSHSLMACRVGGVICALIFASMLGQYGMTPLLVVVGFFVPYGFAPIRRWVEGHGYFLILNWIILLALFFLVITVAAILGPIYAVYAHLKIAKCKELAA